MPSWILRRALRKAASTPSRGSASTPSSPKSVLCRIDPLEPYLHGLADLLAEGGKVGFTENYRGGRLLFWLRRNVIHRGRFGYKSLYTGITPAQITLFRERFANFSARRYWGLVYAILGSKR